jgi:hypothetical protein
MTGNELNDFVASFYHLNNHIQRAILIDSSNNRAQSLVVVNRLDKITNKHDLSSQFSIILFVHHYIFFYYFLKRQVSKIAHILVNVKE